MNKIHLLLADDDIDDCTFFEEALEDLPVSANLSTVHDGVQLMNFLSAQSEQLPDMLFLDLNMPLKNGFECLSEIKANPRFKDLPVIIFSTSFSIDVVDSLYAKGANFYIRKPGEYNKLKSVILEAVSLISADKFIQPVRNEFVLYP